MTILSQTRNLMRRAIKALSVKSPHVGRIESGEKTLEIRSRPTHYRGPVIICASKAPAPKGEPVGVTRCRADLYGCRPFRPDDAAAACLPWQPNLWAWQLRNVRSIDRVPVRGQLGLFNLASDIADQLDRTICGPAS